MILKLMSFNQMHITTPETDFIDGFDNIKVISYDMEQHVNSGYSCVVSYYTTEGTKICKQLMLFKNTELVRVLYIDLNYSIYLMSNEGKTIERIN